jgi:hypothetical protein
MVGPNRVCALKCIGSAGSAVISQFYSDLCPEHDQWVFAKRHPGPYCCPLLDAQYHEVLHAASRCVVPCAQPKPLERWYTFLFAKATGSAWALLLLQPLAAAAAADESRFIRSASAEGQSSF